jgi:hypothetical protein
MFLTKQRREVLYHPERLESLGKTSDTPHMELLPRPKKQTNCQEIVHRLSEVALHAIRHRGDPIQDVTDRLPESRRTLRHRFILEHLFEVIVEELISSHASTASAS